MIKIAFRFDDPSPVSKRKVEESVFDEFFSRQIPLTCAVIPIRLRGGNEIRFSSETTAFFLQATSTGLLEIALHGHFHRDAKLSPCGRSSEFAGVPLQRQMEWIANGRKELETRLQCRISGFVPPWNSYDGGTIDALEDMDFNYLSAGMSLPPKVSSGLRVLPATCLLGELDSAISWARRFERWNPIIIVVMHHYDFDQDPDDPPHRVFTYGELGTLLDTVRHTPEMKFQTLNGMAQSLNSKESKFWHKQLILREATPERFKYLVPKMSLITRWLPY